MEFTGSPSDDIRRRALPRSAHRASTHTTAVACETQSGRSFRACTRCRAIREQADCDRLLALFERSRLRSLSATMQCGLTKAITHADNGSVHCSLAADESIHPLALWAACRFLQVPYRAMRDMHGDVQRGERLARRVEGMVKASAGGRTGPRRQRGHSTRQSACVAAALREVSAGNACPCTTDDVVSLLITTGPGVITNCHNVFCGKRALTPTAFPLLTWVRERPDTERDVRLACDAAAAAGYRVDHRTEAIKPRNVRSARLLCSPQWLLTAPKVLTSDFACMADGNGTEWLAYLQNAIDKGEHAEFKRALPIAIDCMASSGRSGVSWNVRCLDSLDMLVDAGTLADESNRPAVRVFLHQCSNGKACFSEILRTLICAIGKQTLLNAEGADPSAGLQENFARIWKMPAGSSANGLLSDVLDLISITDDEIGRDTPIVVQGGGIRGGRTVRGYLCAPDVSTEQGDFGTDSMECWEIEGDRVYASLSRVTQDRRILRLMIAVNGTARLHLPTYIDNCIARWKAEPLW